jgi:hypothetical protein
MTVSSKQTGREVIVRLKESGAEITFHREGLRADLQWNRRKRSADSCHCRQTQPMSNIDLKSRDRQCLDGITLIVEALRIDARPQGAGRVW